MGPSHRRSALRDRRREPRGWAESRRSASWRRRTTGRRGRHNSPSRPLSRCEPDFHAALLTALAAIRAKGCALPLRAAAAASRLAAGRDGDLPGRGRGARCTRPVARGLPGLRAHRPGSRSSRDRQARDAGDEPVSAGGARARRRGSGAGTELGRQARLSHERRGRCARAAPPARGGTNPERGGLVSPCAGRRAGLARGARHTRALHERHRARRRGDDARRRKLRLLYPPAAIARSALSSFTGFV